MKSALIVLALGRASAFVALAPRVRYTAAAAAHGPSPIMRAPPVEEFLPDASVLDPYAAAGAGGDIDILLNAAIFLIALAITSRLVSSSLDDEIGDSTPSNEGVSGFTWLHADMRMPLPSWDELQTACHMVGTHNGRYMYLCASSVTAERAAKNGEGLDGCQVSADFSKFYEGKTVYVCAGETVAGRRDELS